MRLHDVMTRRGWRKITIGGAFVLLGLAGIGLPHSWAQSRNTDDAQPPAEPSGISGEGAQAAYYNTRMFSPYTTRSQTTPSLPRRPPSVSPDHDFDLSPSRALLAVSRSYYYAGGGFGQPAPTLAAGLPVEVRAIVLPWNQRGFKDYDALAEAPQVSSRALRRKYTFEAVPLAQRSPVAKPEAALLVVHLPEHSLFWVEGKRVRLVGPTRSLRSPPLSPGGRYSYRLRADWLEDGQWVSQTRTVPIRAGLIEAVYLRSR